jgi:hypothetical protein
VGSDQDDFLISCLNAAVLIKGSLKEKAMKKTTQQRACVGLVFVAALLTKIPLANAQQKTIVFPEVADGAFSDGDYYKTTSVILPGSSTSFVTCDFVLYGLGVDLDGKGLVTRWTAAILPGSYYVSTSSANQQISAGYATLSCTDSVYAQVLYSAYKKDGTWLNIAPALGASCLAVESAQMAADQQGGSLAFAIANNTTQTRTYDVIFSDTHNHSVFGTLTIPAQTSVAKFLTEVLPASANSVGSMTIVLNASTYLDPGFAVMALRYTAAAFTTIPVACVPIC